MRVGTPQKNDRLTVPKLVAKMASGSFHGVRDARLESIGTSRAHGLVNGIACATIFPIGAGLSVCQPDCCCVCHMIPLLLIPDALLDGDDSAVTAKRQSGACS